MVRRLVICSVIALSCHDPVAPTGRALKVTNQAYSLTCSPICQPVIGIDTLAVSVWPTTDSFHVVLKVPFGATRCVHVADELTPAYVGGVTAHGIIAVALERVDLSASDGWRWVVRDTLYNGAWVMPSPSSFAAASVCR